MKRNSLRVLGIALIVLPSLLELAGLFAYTWSNYLYWIIGSDSEAFLPRVSDTLEHVINLVMMFGGLLLAIKAKTLSTKQIRIISFGILGAFVVQPIQTYFLWDVPFGFDGFYAFKSNFAHQFFGWFDSGNSSLTITSFLSGFVLLLVILSTLVLAIVDKGPDMVPYPMRETNGFQKVESSTGNLMAGQIASLQQLHASGALSDAEFEAAKKRIIEG